MVNLQVKDDLSNFIPTEQSNSKRASISILLVDDQISIRESLHLSLQPEPDLKVMAKAIDGLTAISQVETFAPDVVLMDIEMPGMSGLEAAKIIKDRSADTKIIILTSYDDNKYIEQALRIGVNGYLLKTTPTSEIVSAIRHVHQGYLQLGSGLLEKLHSEQLEKPQDQTPEDLDNCDRSSTETRSESQQNAEIDRDSQQCRSIVYVPKSSSSIVSTRPPEADSNEWSSLTRELIETLPRVWTRGLLYALMVIVGIVLPWAMLSKVDETGSARGKLEPEGQVFAVDAPVSGTVDEVFVSEGELVTSQQPLLSLESEPVENELEQIQTQLEGQEKELAQLKLLKNQLVLTVNTQRQQNTAQLFEKQAQLDRAKQDIKHSQTALNLAAKANEEAQKEVQRFVEAKNQGIVSEIQVVQQRDEARERERLLEQANSESAQAQLRAVEQQKSYQSMTHSGDIAVLRGQEQLKEIEQQILTLNAQIKSNQSKLDGLNYQLEQRVVKSPVDGSIFQLPAQEKGTVIEPGGLVAEIAPQESPLVLKAQMIPTESGSLEQGMPVKMKFDAYPFQDYGVVEGELVSISPTTKLIDTPQGKAESYELEVKLDRDHIQAKNKRVDLRAGQTATAEVIVRQRRLIDFVLDPFKKLNEDGLEL